MERNKCKICNVTLTDESIRLAHYSGKKHLLQKKQKKCEIIVTNLPNQFDRIHIRSFFEKFGPIVYSKFSSKNDYIIFRYNYRTKIKKLLKKPLLYFQQELKVQSTLNLDDSPIIEDVVGGEFEDVCKALSNGTDLSFVEQVQIFLNIVTPNKDDEYYRNIDVLLIDLEYLLKPKFPSCEIYMFGSTTNHLSFKNSDIDIYVKPGELIGQMKWQKTLIKHARTLIYKDKKKLFSIVKVLLHAKVPIIKCIHIPTNINCDLNFLNALAVNNSRFIKYYSILNDNFIPTLLILKYWAKLHKFILSSNGFTSYSIIMMFIFFVQQLDSTYPSVHSMQRNNKYDVFEADWNCGFEEKEIIKNDETREHSIIELLKGFYGFYRDFQYDLYIVCPYLGELISKSDFLHTDKLGDEFRLYKRNIVESKKPLNVENLLCIQDPFDHLKNISNGVSFKLLQKFVKDCSISYQILIKEEPSLIDFLKGFGASEPVDATCSNVCNIEQYQMNTEPILKNTRLMLLNLKPTLDKEKLSLDNEKSSSSNVKSSSDDGKPSLDNTKLKDNVNCKLHFHIGMSNCDNYLKLQILKEKLIDVDLMKRKLWFNAFTNFFRSVLKDVLKLNVVQEKIINNVEVKHKTFDDEFNNIVQIQCNGSKDVIAGRKKINLKLKYPKSVNGVLEKEEFLSNFVKNQSIKVSYDIDFIVIPLRNPTEIKVEMIKLKNFKGCFKTISTFIIRNIPKWFSLHQNELNVEAKKEMLQMDKNLLLIK